MFLSQIWPAKIEAFNSWYLSLDGCRELWQTKNSICGKRWPGNMLDCIEFLPAFLHFSTSLFVFGMVRVPLHVIQSSVASATFVFSATFWGRSRLLNHLNSPKTPSWNCVFEKKTIRMYVLPIALPIQRSSNETFTKKKYGWTFFAKAEKVFFFFASSKDMFDVFRCHFLRHFPKTLNCSSKGFLFHQNHKSVIILGKTSTLWVTHPTPTCFSMFPQWLQSLCVSNCFWKKKTWTHGKLEAKWVTMKWYHSQLRSKISKKSGEKSHGTSDILCLSTIWHIYIP